MFIGTNLISKRKINIKLQVIIIFIIQITYDAVTLSINTHKIKNIYY